MFGDPQSLNLYTYVRNDPVSSADADGHCSQCLQYPNQYYPGQGLDAGYDAYAAEEDRVVVAQSSAAVTAQNQNSGGFWQKLGNALSGHGWKTNADVAKDPTHVSVVGAETSDYRGADTAKGVLNQFHSVVTGMDKSGMRRTGSGEANGEMNDAQHWTNGYMGCQDQAYMAQALLSGQHNGYEFVVQGEDPVPGGAYRNYGVVGLPDNPGNPTLFLSPWLNSATVVVPPQ